MTARDRRDVVEHDLVPILTDPPQDTAGAPSAVLLVDPHATPALGVAFGVVVRNDGWDPIHLDQPYESLTYTLADERGEPVQPDAPPRRAKLDGATRDLRERAAYVELHAALVGEREVDVDEWLSAPTIELAPADTLEIDLALREVPGDGAGTVPLAAGAYSLSVLLPLAWRSGDDRRSIILTTAAPIEVLVAEG